jgi:hypothetical protein
MDFRTRLSNIPSGVGKEWLIGEVGDSRKHFDSLLDIALEEGEPLNWRAAWILDGSDEQHPGLASHAISRMVSSLPGIESVGVLRILLRLLSRYEVKEEDQGVLIDLCFGYMVTERFPVAVKVHAMQILYNHVLIYPELKDELITVIEDQMDNNSVGFRARSMILIKQLEKLG